MSDVANDTKADLWFALVMLVKLAQWEWGVPGVVLMEACMVPDGSLTGTWFCLDLIVLKGGGVAPVHLSFGFAYPGAFIGQCASYTKVVDGVMTCCDDISAKAVVAKSLLSEADGRRWPTVAAKAVKCLLN